MSGAPVVTIDGPGGAGKGTVSALLSAALGWRLLDSGALYRLTALAARQQGVALDDEPAVAAVAGALAAEFVAAEGGARIELGGVEVSGAIRNEQIGADASLIAALPSVRTALLARQRTFRQPPGLVADGRDMGTVVFVDAPVKIFLTASAEERARRRLDQLRGQGVSATLQGLLEEIRARDERDRNRAVAPLKPAADAVTIDSTELEISAVVARIRSLLAERGF